MVVRPWTIAMDMDHTYGGQTNGMDLGQEMVHGLTNAAAPTWARKWSMV